MPTRYTMKMLEELTDYELIQLLIADRLESTTNSYAPLPQRLKNLRGKLDRGEELTRRVG